LNLSLLGDPRARVLPAWRPTGGIISYRAQEIKGIPKKCGILLSNDGSEGRVEEFEVRSGELEDERAKELAEQCSRFGWVGFIKRPPGGVSRASEYVA
jgi:hypothetical protein